MTYLERGGIRIYYELRGRNEGIPLLLTHGFGASSQMWAPNVTALAAERPVITWDSATPGQDSGTTRRGSDGTTGPWRPPPAWSKTGFRRSVTDRGRQTPRTQWAWRTPPAGC